MDKLAAALEKTAGIGPAPQLSDEQMAELMTQVASEPKKAKR